MEPFPQFSTEVKLALREAQLNILKSRENIREAQNQLAQLESSFQQLIQKSIADIGLKTALLDLATLTLSPSLQVAETPGPVAVADSAKRGRPRKAVEALVVQDTAV